MSKPPKKTEANAKSKLKKTAPDDWGEAYPDSPSPKVKSQHLRNLQQRFLKKHQLIVLELLLLTVVILMFADNAWTKTYIKDLLPILLPIFTFMIGMQSRSKDE